MALGYPPDLLESRHQCSRLNRARKGKAKDAPLTALPPGELRALAALIRRAEPKPDKSRPRVRAQRRSYRLTGVTAGRVPSTVATRPGTGPRAGRRRAESPVRSPGSCDDPIAVVLSEQGLEPRLGAGHGAAFSMLLPPSNGPTTHISGRQSPLTWLGERLDDATSYQGSPWSGSPTGTRRRGDAVDYSCRHRAAMARADLVRRRT